MKYSNPVTHLEVNDWPYGRLRTTATFLVETTPRGERAVRITVNPKTGKANAPKKMTFVNRVRIVTGEDGKTYILEDTGTHFTIIKSNMMHMEESFFAGDPGYNELANLFD